MNSESPTPVTVTIAVPTYRRPETLAASLAALTVQAEDCTGPQFDVHVLVIDNDGERSARDVAAGYKRVRYEVETAPGVVAVRNRALDVCGSDLLIFIDDDERPSEGWLEALLSTWQHTRAHAVAGRVVSTFEGEMDPWVGASDFWARRRMATGTTVDVVATGNLLLDVRFVDLHRLRFSPVFGMTGGEDMYFSLQMRRAGAAMVWCDESIAIDVLPAERVTREWIRARSARNGSTIAQIDLISRRGPQLPRRVLLAGRGAVRVASGGSRLAFGKVSGRLRHQARGFRTMHRGVGLVAGALGYTYVEYAREGEKWRRGLQGTDAQEC